MELVNQVIFAIFGLILLGIYLSTTDTRAVGVGKDDQGFWPWTILLRAFAYLTWALVPLVGGWLLLVANVFYVSSVLLLVLFLRSWTTSTSSELKRALIVFLVLYSLTFAFLLSLPDSFNLRFLLTTGVTLCAFLWELWIVFQNTRTSNIYLIKILLAIVFIQVVLATLLMVRVGLLGLPGMSNLLQANTSNLSMLLLWITFGTHLLGYIVINSFLYRRLWDSERQALKELKNKRVELQETTIEKEEVEHLLLERDALVTSLSKANKTAATGALAASIVHEMAQPLAVIQMNADFLSKLNREQPLAQQTASEMLDGILKNNQHAANIVKTLRSIFLQAESKLQRVHLPELVNSVVSLADADVHRRSIKLTIDVSPNIYLNVYSNELFQVLLNLLNNALQAIGESSIEKKGEVVIHAEQVDDSVLITIADNGPGIPQKEQGRLFELFALTTKPDSMGLGLWLCAYIVQRHQGAIWYEDNPQGGAKFFIRLPVQPLNEPDSPELG